MNDKEQEVRQTAIFNSLKNVLEYLDFLEERTKKNLKVSKKTQRLQGQFDLIKEIKDELKGVGSFLYLKYLEEQEGKNKID